MPRVPGVPETEPAVAVAHSAEACPPQTVLYVLSFVPTYVSQELRALAQRGVRVRVVLPAAYPRAAMWDHINGGGLRDPDVRTIDFHWWLAAPARAIARPGAALLARLVGRFPHRALQVAARSAREGTLRHLLAAACIIEAMRGEPIDRVHSHFATDPAYVGLLLAELTGVPFTVTTHAHDLFVPRFPLRLRRLLQRATHVLTISAFNQASLERAGDADVGSRVRVLHLGVDVDSLPSWSPVTDRFDILCTASGLGEKKGVPVLIEACRLLKSKQRHFRCRVCGGDPSGERLAELRRLVQSQGLDDDVRLVGVVPWEQTQALVSHASVFVHPSVRTAAGDMDGIPISLMEAMAIGAPVVASRLSGIPELIDDASTGLLVPPGDADALAAAIERVMNHPGEAAAMARRGCERVRTDFNLAGYVDRLLEVWAASLPAAVRVVENLGDKLTLS